MNIKDWFLGSPSETNTTTTLVQGTNYVPVIIVIVAAFVVIGLIYFN
jgi:hypothetical protein